MTIINILSLALIVLVLFILFLSVLLVVSVGFIGVLWWFCSKMNNERSFIVSNIDDATTGIKNYEAHLERIYNMPTFYGDEDLLKLLQHTKEMRRYLSDFRDNFYIEEYEEEEKDDSEEK